MKVVVTGGAGFIGANLCRVLVATEGIDQVVAFDDLSTGSADNLADAPAVRLIEATILDPDALDAAFAGASAVVHLAARPSVPRSLEDPMASHEVNATGTVQVLQALRRTGTRPHLVVASSSSVYGATPVLPKTEGLPTAPMSPYAASKLAAESYALAFARSYHLDVLALRFFNVFGPLQPAGHSYAAVIPAFVSAAVARRPLPVHGDGRQTRDFTYVESVAGIIVAALLGRVVGDGPVNLAFGTRVSLLEVIALLEDILGRTLPVEHLPPRAGDVRDSQADQSCLRSLFPHLVPVGLEEGLRATVEWFASRAAPALAPTPDPVHGGGASTIGRAV